MKIFYYTWFENSEQDMAEALSRMGHCVVKCHIPMNDYKEDEAFSSNLERIFIEQKCDMFMSFNFFPLIAKCAERLKVKYAAWIYDSPHRTLCSQAVTCEGTYLFLFDEIQHREVKRMGAKHAYHLSLPVNTRRINQLLGEDFEHTGYQYDISFVGSLYEKNMYQQISYLPEHIKGYIDGICAAQKKIYGYNFIAEMLNSDVVEEINQYVKVDIDQGYHMNYKQIYADMINAKITSEERIEMLRSLGTWHNVTLFSASDISLVPEVKAGGVVSYEEKMPWIFRNSKINLNITLRSIQSGIPLRALDIMGAGGFLLTNYQQEIAENFVAGEEVVMFQSVEELLYLTDYYLEHEEERKEIAYCGWKKVCEKFSYDTQLDKIFSILNQ